MKITVIEAIERLTSGQVVSLPTETVYGLAACLNQPKAIENIFKLKGRPLHNPLIIHVANIQQIEDYLLHPVSLFDELASTFWPGPLTIILPIQTLKISEIVRAHLPSAAFRIPDQADTLRIIKEVGPLVMPSANISGYPSATMADHVEKDFGVDFPVLDGGSCEKGLESTILYYLNPTWVILRMGALTGESLEKVLGYRPEFFLTTEQQKKPLSPGQLLRHYSPHARLILGDPSALERAPFIVGFRERSYPEKSRVLYLGSINDVNEVANNLYHILRELDIQKSSWAWVDINFPTHGLWKTVSDRLTKAADTEPDDFT